MEIIMGICSGLFQDIAHASIFNFFKNKKELYKIYDDCHKEICKLNNIITDTNKDKLYQALDKWINSKEFEHFLNHLKEENNQGNSKDLIDQLNNELAVANLDKILNSEDIVKLFIKKLDLHLRATNPTYKELVSIKNENLFIEKLDKIQDSSERRNVNINGNNLIDQGTHSLVEPISVEEQYYFSTIELAKEHCLHANHNKALELLEGLRNEISSKNVSQNLLLALSNNLITSYLYLEKFNLAYDEALKAIGITKTRLTYSNAANAAYQNDEFKAALHFIDQALDFEPENPYSLAIKVQILARIKEKAVLAKFISDHPIVNNDPNCLMMLGQIAIDDQRFEEAQNYFHQARVLKPYSAMLYQLEGQSIIIPIEKQHKLNYLYFTNDQIQEAENEKLIRVEKLASECLNLLNTSDMIVDKNRAYLLRASARFYQKKFIDALNDCKEALSNDSSNIFGNTMAAILSVFINRDYKYAINCLQNIDEKLQPDQNKVLMLDCYIEINEQAKAEVILDEIEKIKNSLLIPEFIFIEFKLKFYQKFKQESENISILKEYAVKYEDEPDILYVIGNSYFILQKYNDSLQILNHAEKLPAKILKNEIVKLKARVYLSLNLWKLAVETFEKFVDNTINSLDLYDYIIALANDRQIGSAGVLAKQARLREGLPIKIITDIEADYLYNFGFQHEAKDLCLKLIDNNLATKETYSRLKMINTQLGINH